MMGEALIGKQFKLRVDTCGGFMVLTVNTALPNQNPGSADRWIYECTEKSGFNYFLFTQGFFDGKYGTDTVGGFMGWYEPGCEHDWKYYQGLTDTYDYCSKCDKKRDSEINPRYKRTA